MSAGAVVVTGAGVLCPIADDRPSFAQALAGGRSATRIESGFGARLTLNQSRRLDRLAQILLVAGMEAAAAARLDEVAPGRVGLVVGTGLGCLEKTASQLRGIAAAGMRHLDPLGFPESMDNSPAAHAAVALRCHGPSLSLREREISGESAILVAAALLAADRADAVLVLAGDAPGADAALAPAESARGMKLGEGAGAIVVEPADAAARRGVAPMARITAWARSFGDVLPPRMRAEPVVVAAVEDHAWTMAEADRSRRRSVGPDALVERIGWCPADGVLRAIVAMSMLETDHGGAVLVSGAARGGAVAALVLAQAASA